jgi:large subunit ribosomal protein L29
MKSAEIKKKSKEDLKKMVKEMREKLRALRFDLAAGKVKNVREIRLIKKDIAKILTILREARNVKRET